MRKRFNINLSIYLSLAFLFGLPNLSIAAGTKKNVDKNVIKQTKTHQASLKSKPKKKKGKKELVETVKEKEGKLQEITDDQLKLYINVQEAINEVRLKEIKPKYITELKKVKGISIARYRMIQLAGKDLKKIKQLNINKKEQEALAKIMKIRQQLYVIYEKAYIDIITKKVGVVLYNYISEQLEANAGVRKRYEALKSKVVGATHKKK